MNNNNATIAQEILDALTLSEKARLCTGKSFWFLPDIEHFELPSIMLSDGPHGLRKQPVGGDQVGLSDAALATCFPTASGLAASWNPALIEEMAIALAKECRAAGVSVLLGPGTNIKRNPLGGRNFEYFSEDPLLSAALATAWIQGVQSLQVGASLKHYAVNNHENGRMTVDAIVDQRTLREIYLPAFELAISNAQPWTVMCAYNKLNGSYLAEHSQLLNDILYQQWQYSGLVVTDWGANNDRIAGIKAGQALEMPSSGELYVDKIIAAIDSGELTMAELDKSVSRVLQLILKAKAALDQPSLAVDLEDHHKLAARIAEQTCVLLKNDHDFLPIAKDTGTRIAVIGALAEHTRYQGAGSSKISPFKLEQPLNEIQQQFGHDMVDYAPGYSLVDELDADAVEHAVNIAKQADVIFLFVGLTAKYESEGFDRSHIQLPQAQLDLIDALDTQLGKTVVILQNGAPVAMPFVERTPAILESYLGGQAGASAVAKVLSGAVNPSGKLAETFPLALEDVASSPYFPGTKNQSQYREAIWVGYRYFDSTDTPVLFPFGHGLSYTSFGYSNLRVEAPQTLNETNVITLYITITNTGTRAGAEIVQCYVGQRQPSVPRPNKELKGHHKLVLQPGESQDIAINLNYRAFAFWCTQRDCWVAESDDYNIYVGASIADIRASETVFIHTEFETAAPAAELKPYFEPAARDFNDDAFAALLGHPIPKETPSLPYNLNTRLGEIADTSTGKPIFEQILAVLMALMGGNDSPDAEAERLMARAVVEDMPLRNLPIFYPDAFSETTVTLLLTELNKVFGGQC